MDKYPTVESLHKVVHFLPLDGDFINENGRVANLDLTPRIASVHKSQFAMAMLVECWTETVYYYGILLNLDASRMCMIRDQYVHASIVEIIGYCREWTNTEFLVGEMCYFMILRRGYDLMERIVC